MSAGGLTAAQEVPVALTREPKTLHMLPYGSPCSTILQGFSPLEATLE